MGNTPLPMPANNITPATEYGGWGALTAGMLNIDSGEKSYGVFGQYDSYKDAAGATVSVTEPKYGITSDFRSMTPIKTTVNPTAE